MPDWYSNPEGPLQFFLLNGGVSPVTEAPCWCFRYRCLWSSQPVMRRHERGGIVPTVISHALVPLTVAIAAGSRRIPPKVVVAGMLLAMLPDLDVIGFRFGISYDATWGHRGAMHSLA